MSSGFVYIMFNPALKGLVKIGLTKRTSKIRAQELKSTGLPDSFIVIYDELVTDCILVEKMLHKRFEDYRYEKNREFFQIPIRDAIRGLMEESEGFIVPRVGSSKGVEILSDLKRKYPSYLKSDFHSIKIIHIDGIVYLESMRYRHKNLKDEIVERLDLSFIIEDDEYSLIMCTDLFTPEACQKIDNKHHIITDYPMQELATKN